MAEKSINLALLPRIIGQLKAGDRLLLTGTIYTARDAAHQRLIRLIRARKKLPFNIKNQVIYYVGPTPASKNQVIGSAGPTTSDRMDRFTPILLAQGLKGMIGKGPRSNEVKKAFKKNKAIYFGAIGGAGALLAKAIKSAEIVTFADLGTEAVRKLKVENFPVIVLNDSYGNDLYEQRNKRRREHL